MCMKDGTLLAYHTWISLPRETRIKLVQLFEIPRTGEVIVRTITTKNGNPIGEVQQDGHAPVDLYAITLQKLQQFTGSRSDNFDALFEEVVANIDAILDGSYAKGSLTVPQNVPAQAEETVSPEEKQRLKDLMAQPKPTKPTWQQFIKENKGKFKNLKEASVAYKAL